MKLSLVIPAHNEANRLGALLNSYPDYFQHRYGDEAELIIVVNGSRDATADMVCAAQVKYPNLRLLVEPAAVGKGGALIEGFAVARGDLVGFVDADASTPPDAFDDLVTHLEDADMIIASRWIHGAHISPPQPLSRRFASRVFNILVRFLFKIPIHDTQCGAKLMRADMLRVVLPHLGVTRWAFDVDLLFQILQAGGKITEHPTVWRDVAGSKVRIVRASLEMSIALMRLRLYYSPLRWIVTLYDRTLGRMIH